MTERTAMPADEAGRADGRPWDRRLPVAPAGGWLSLVLVVAMCVVLALAIDDARVIVGRSELTDLLVWAAIGGALFGCLGPSIGWGRWTTYALGAITAALVVPLLVGAAMPESAADPTRWYPAASRAAVAAFIDLVVENLQLTREIGHHMLLLGLLVWASSMFAGYAVFGHRRPLNAVLLIGILLVANIGLTLNDQLVYLVAFSLAALFLLIRTHTFEEQADWLRRRIGDPSAIAGLYLRGGTLFIAVAVIGSLLLTRAASSAPLAGAWTDLGAQVVDWTRGIGRFLPRSPTGPALAPEFGSEVTVEGTWVTSNEILLTIQLQPQDIANDVLWRRATYDVLNVTGFGTSDQTTTGRVVGEPLLEGTIDQASETGTVPFTFTVIPAQARADIVSPDTPQTVNEATRERTVGEAGFFAGLDRDWSRDAYTVTALLPKVGDAEGGLTKNRLRVAGTDYPEEIRTRYAQPPDRGSGVVGPAFDEVYAEIVALGAGNPYDFAAAVTNHLQDGEVFFYDTNTEDDGLDCGDRSYIECFAFRRHGFCQHYASLMVALMREAGYPARVAQGFRTGQADPIRLTRTVRFLDAHAWVEVYFPGHGWVEFDPTGGTVGAGEPDLPQGAVQASGSPRPSGSALARPSESELIDNEPPPVPPVTPTANIAGPLIVVSLLLAMGVGLLAFVAWRRGPRGPVTADGAYGMVTRLAGRFGFAPRPEQTVYEYAGALGEVLPDARPHLETVAAAKVEVAYGGRKLGVDRLLSLRAAQRALRTSLLRLAFRRDRIGRLRRPRVIRRPGSR
jgi:transglutaminase-like putative cysteine protease